MGFISVLKAVASKAGKILGIASQVGAEIAPFLPPNIGGFLGIAIKGVAKAEAVASKLAAVGISVGGQGKLAIADAFAADGLDIAELVAGKEIGDNEKYKRGVAAVIEGRQKVLSGVADILDSLEHPGGETPSPTNQ